MHVRRKLRGELSAERQAVQGGGMGDERWRKVQRELWLKIERVLVHGSEPRVG